MLAIYNVLWLLTVPFVEKCKPSLSDNSIDLFMRHFSLSVVVYRHTHQNFRISFHYMSAILGKIQVGIKSLSLRGQHNSTNTEKDKFGCSSITIVRLICKVSLAHLGVLLSASSLLIYLRMDKSLGTINNVMLMESCFILLFSGTFLKKKLLRSFKKNKIQWILQQDFQENIYE